MDAFELLKKDHKKVSQLFEKIESANGNAKNALFNQLKGELDLHAHVEEKFLYPALENKEPSRDIALEAYEEHKVVKDLLAELATGAPGDEWDAKLTVLKENVEHHVEEEEGELFSKAREVLSQEQIEVIGAEMEGEKAAQGQPPANRTSAEKGASKSKTTTRKSESPGVLTRLANFVGLGSDSSPTQSSKSSKAAKKKAPAKKAASTKKTGGKAKAGKAATRSASKKGAVKTTSKKAGGKKASKTAAKAAKKSAPARKAAGKKAPARKK